MVQTLKKNIIERRKTERFELLGKFHIVCGEERSKCEGVGRGSEEGKEGARIGECERNH